MAEKKMEY